MLHEAEEENVSELTECLTGVQDTLKHMKVAMTKIHGKNFIKHFDYFYLILCDYKDIETIQKQVIKSS